MEPEEKAKARRLFKELEADLVAWCYSVELYFCNKHKDSKGKLLERWHVVLVGQNNWNDEPWGEKYTFNTQAEAWKHAKELGDKWMQ